MLIKNILMTGSTGFLGSHLLRYLLDTFPDASITIIRRSFSNTWRINGELDRVTEFNLDQDDLNQLFKRYSFELIIHCATDYGLKNVSRVEIIEANLLLPLKLLEYGLNSSLKLFVNTDTMLEKNISHYSLSKRQFRDWLIDASGSILAINLVLEHFYGPGDDYSKFISSMIRSMVAGEPEILLTPGMQTRDFIYIDDVISAIGMILDKSLNVIVPKNAFVEYQIGSGFPVSIREVLLKIQKYTNNTITSLKFGALPYRNNEQMHPRLDLEKLFRLGWSPKVSLDSGLSKTIRYELNQKL